MTDTQTAMIVSGLSDIQHDTAVTFVAVCVLVFIGLASLVWSWRRG